MKATWCVSACCLLMRESILLSHMGLAGTQSTMLPLVATWSVSACCLQMRESILLSLVGTAIKCNPHERPSHLVEKQVLIIFAGTNAYLDDLPVEQIRSFEEGLYKFVENAHPGLLPKIREKKVLDDEIKGQVHAALKEFKQRFVSEQKK